MLGSGPTRDDVKQGEALSGHMGKEVRAALDEAGIRREEILVLHTYVCTAKEPKRDKEEKAATLACRGLLWKALGKVGMHTPMMLSGKWALLGVNGKQEGIFNSRGFVDATWTITRKGDADEK